MDDKLTTNSQQLAAINQPLNHHVFEDKWISRPSNTHPTLIEQLQPLADDPKHFGHPLDKNRKWKEVSIPL